jgi:hypothetical protein
MLCSQLVPVESWSEFLLDFICPGRYFQFELSAKDTNVWLVVVA